MAAIAIDTGARHKQRKMATQHGQAAKWRRMAAQIGDDIADMVSTQCRIADRSRLGWDDPSIAQIEHSIQQFAHQRQKLLARARTLGG